MERVPEGWRTYDEFAFGIDTNRLPTSEALVGTSLAILHTAGRLALDFLDKGAVRWTDDSSSGVGVADVVEVAPSTYFIDLTFAERPLEAITVVVDVGRGRALLIRSHIRSAEEAGAEPRVAQDFWPGTVDGVDPTGFIAAPTRDLIGKRTWQTYSPAHVYEHTYLSSERYCWQCLVGVQRGHGFVDMASHYKISEEQYVFCFREFLIPVASVFFFNFADGRSTGKFLGITGTGEISNSRAGAFIQLASVTTYPPDIEPV